MFSVLLHIALKCGLLWRPLWNIGALKPGWDTARTGSFETKDMVCPLHIVIGSCSLKALSVHEDCQGGKWRSSVNFWWVRFGECLAMARKINDCVRMMFSIVHWLQCATCLLADTVCEGREMMTRDGNEFWRSNIQFLSSCLGSKLCWFKWIYSYLALLLLMRTWNWVPLKLSSLWNFIPFLVLFPSGLRDIKEKVGGTEN